MRHKLKLAFGTLLLTIITIAACRRQEVLRKPYSISSVAAQAWFQKNGQEYKDGVIAVDGPNGRVTARLDWSKAKPITWKGKSYIDVPYLFSNGNRYLSGGEELGAATFNLVIRGYRNGDFRAAIRTVTHEVDDNGKTIQTYKLLNGAEGNSWYTDNKYTTPIAAQKQNVIYKTKTSPRGVVYTDSANCLIQTTTTYSGNCNYSVGEMVYVVLCPNVQQMAICPPELNDNDDDDNNPFNPSGGTNPNPNPNPDPEEPSTECSDEPQPAPPMNPDGTDAPYEELPPCEQFPPEQDLDQDFLLKLTKEDQAKYPRLTDMTKKLLDYVKNNPKVLQALMDYSGLTKSQILDKLKFGNGPLIQIKEFGNNSKYGTFNGPENPNVLNLNAAFVRGLEAATLQGTIDATSFLLAVSALHEFIHYGRFFNGLSEGIYDYGLGFERDVYGVTIDKDNAGKYSWQFYKK